MKGAHYMNNTVKVDKDGSVCLKEVLKGTTVDVDDVHYYEMDNTGRGIELTVFDKNKKQINIKIKTRKLLAEKIDLIIKRCSNMWFPKDLLELIKKEIQDE